MSWQSDDGRHEGYAAHITRDGQTAVASCFAGLVTTFGREPSEDVILPWAELLGWEARCTCGWVGPMWRRLNADDQDAGEVAADESFISELRPWRTTLEDVIGDLWAAHVKQRTSVGGFRSG